MKELLSLVGKFVGGGIAVVVVILGLYIAVNSWGTVDPGHRGVYVHMGAVTGEIANEGFYWKNPFLDTVVHMDVRTQKEEVTTECASKDLQTVDAVIALNINLDPRDCAKIYQEIGMDYGNKVVSPAVQEAYKAVVANYTAEELITKREIVRENIISLVKGKLHVFGIETTAVNIVNFKFSNVFNAAIEAKVTAEQNALAAKNMLAQKEYEAQQVVATAKGKAEALALESAALAKNPQILQLKALERWDGKLPVFIGGSGTMPMINMDTFLNGAK